MPGLTRFGGHLYASQLYADALSHVGRALPVDAWGSFVLARRLPGDAGQDAIGAYPMATMDPGGDLAAGLAELAGRGLVSLVMVPDPFVSPPPERLAAAFDVCRPFKTHYLVEPARGLEFSKHHRDRVRRGARRCRIEQVALADNLSVWRHLYGELVDRRSIRGAADFTPEYFVTLARAPDLVAFAALVEGRPAAMTLWFEHAGVAYNHLTASNPLGYANGANFALYGAAIEHFRAANVMNLGGGAGLDDDPEDGLAAFKRGFANGSTQALVCGAVLDAERYASLTAGLAETTFFPAYRAPARG